MEEREEKREAWRVRLGALASSGLTQREFCAREGVSLHQLSYWRGRLNERAAATAPRWCALDVAGDGAEARDAMREAMTVRVGGAGIEVKPGFDPALLRDIVRALKLPGGELPCGQHPFGQHPLGESAPC